MYNFFYYSNASHSLYNCGTVTTSVNLHDNVCLIKKKKKSGLINKTDFGLKQPKYLFPHAADVIKNVFFAAQQ